MRPAPAHLATVLALAAVLTPAVARAGDPPSPPAAPPAAPAEPAADDAAAAPTAPAPPTVAAEPVMATQPEAARGAAGIETSDVLLMSGATDRRSYAKDWLVAPPGWNLGGEMHFITAGSAPSGERIRMTDMAILRLHTRWTATRRVELAGSIDFLAKQLDTTDEPLPQGGSIAAKIATGKSVAIAGGASGGPTLGGSGFWGSVATGAVHRSKIEDFIAFQVGGGALGTIVEQDGVARRWQTDATLSSELVFHTPRGEWAMWGGFELAFPVAHGGPIDPSSRLDLTVGTVFSAVRDWDLFAEYTFRDRGTTAMPETVLPIVDGGFDQRQLIVGITRRFSPARGTTRWALSQN